MAIVVAVLTALLLATDVFPGVRGPADGGWRWERRPLEPLVPLVAVVVVFALTAAVALRLRRQSNVAARTKRNLLVAGGAGLVFVQMIVLTAVEPGGLANIPRRVLDPSFTSYHTIAAKIESPHAFLQDYHRLQSRFPVHGPSQPPGRALFFWAVNRWAETPGCTAALLRLGESLGGVPEHPPAVAFSTTDAERAGALLAGWLLLGIGALCVVPVVALSGGCGGARAAGAALLLLAALPSTLLFTPQTDHLILLLTATAAALALSALRRAGLGSALVLSFLGGLSGSLAIFVSFTSLAALGAWGLALTAMFWLGSRSGDAAPRPRLTARRCTMILVAGGAGLLVLPVWTSALGMQWPAVFRECTAAAQRIQVLVFGRRYSTWVGWNLWDFVLFLGPPLALAWLAAIPGDVRLLRRAGMRRQPSTVATREHDCSSTIPYALVLLFALLALDLSGRILGETGRIWMFLMPLAVVAVAVRVEQSDRGLLTLASAQLLVLLALRMFLNVPG
jgi:hypothetical protein